MKFVVFGLAMLTAAAAVPVSAQDATAQGIKSTISQTSFTFPNQTAEGFAGIRANLTSGKWVLRPSAEQPHRSFGFIEGPLIDIKKAPDTQEGHTTAMKVTYTFPNNITGSPPEIRLRLNSFDFRHYAIIGITQGRFAAEQNRGGGEATVYFDRRYLENDTQLRLFIDLLTSTGEGGSDPNFYFQVEKIEIINSVAGSPYERAHLITSHFMQSDGDVYLARNGSDDTTRVRSGANSYATSGPFAIVLDSGDLFGYDGRSDFNQTSIATNGAVVSAGVEGPHVIYIEDDREVRYFNFLTGEKKRLASGDREYRWAYGVGNGAFMVMEPRTDNTIRAYLWDTQASNPSLRRLDDDDTARYFNFQGTGYVAPSKTGGALIPQTLSGWRFE